MKEGLFCIYLFWITWATSKQKKNLIKQPLVKKPLMKKTKYVFFIMTILVSYVH